MYSHKNGLILRRVEKSDLLPLLQMKNDSWTTQHHTIFLTQQDQERWYDAVSNSNNYYMIASVESNGGIKDPIVGLVSIIDIDWISRIASVGMMASKIYRGTLWTKRLPEAITDFGFEVLNLRRLEAEVLDNNPAALSFDLNLGYQIEGRKRQAVYKSGNYHDSFLIAMLRDQWKNSDRLLSYGGICNVNYKKRKNIDRVLSRIIKND